MPSRRHRASVSHIDGAIRIDGREVMDRVRRERDRFVGFVLRDVQDIPEADRIRGHARFVDDHTIAVGDHTRIAAKSTRHRNRFPRHLSG